MKKWQSCVVAMDATLGQAISIIDKSGLQIGLVVDAEGRLHGVVTDGDVRRALLRRDSLDVPVEHVMGKTPRVATPDWGHERLRKVMEEFRISQIPLVDHDGKLIGLKTLHDLLGREHVGNPVFLMAGGFGKRPRPLTSDCPKPLLKVGDKPILEIILDSFIEAGFRRYYISTHYLPEMIQAHFGDGSKWGVDITYVHEEVPLGTGGALGLLPHDEINLPMIMMNGDLLSNLNFRGLLDFHTAHGCVATMCVREYEHQIPYGVIESEGHLIRSMVEKPVQKVFVNAGVYALSPELVRSVKPGTQIDMPTLLEQFIHQGSEVASFPVHEYWLDIGRMEDFKRAQSEFGSLLK
ncbi:nucleotidyl transferase [Bordetella ansorpii]|uniref:Nucleotidyl transferase n=1 Tax=Bordetella ansorpii TaxID=288768 RepID=A0A157SWJ0_9BORD|nr:nucleotidyltransferase family protein [Bordetella ansorpii]SAI74830.1 nucleotidyl transferase [Bordetella ansorpii]